MSASTAQSELRLASLLDERDNVTNLHDQLLARVQQNEDKMPDAIQAEAIKTYLERAEKLDAEISTLSEAFEANKRAADQSQKIRRALAGQSSDSVDVDEDGVVYRTMAAFARDYILTRNDTTAGKIAQFVDPLEINAARERMQLVKRTPANTLSSNVGGLIPPQHIDQIFQVIQNDRPIVASAQRADLERGTLTYPVVATRPVVAVQGTEKTEAGNTGMVINMLTATASTYLGGGDLSWQAVNWSTPNALDMWFRLAASDYALKTEQDAAQALQHSGFTYNISSTLASNADFPTTLAGIAAGAGDVYANSGRIANTIYMAPDQLYRLAALASTSTASFINAGNLTLSAQGGSLAGLNVVVSRGMDSGVVVVGDSAGLLVAETAGAPVELRVTEPAIGGYEVGIIGAFEAVVVDPGAFAMITTAS